MSQDVGDAAPANHPGEPPFVRGYNSKGNDWKVIQQINSEKIKEANEFAINAIERGADGVSFKLCFSDKQEDVSNLLKNIDLSKSKYTSTRIIAIVFWQNLFVMKQKREIIMQQI